MKFLHNQALHSNNTYKIEDYIDSKIIGALPPHHQQILTKLVNSQSSHLDKFFHKLTGNQIYLNHDMLLKILDKLRMQMTLPVHSIQMQNMSCEFDSQTSKHNPKIDLWLELQTKLNIWSLYPSDIIYQLLTVSHDYIESEKYPQFPEIEKLTQPRFFWKRKTKTDNLSFDILFKFIFEKFKYFHWELIPQTKRPMDLFELFCPIEDAALENRIIHLNEEQVFFFRSLNASALIYSAIFSFSAAMPELVAHEIELNPSKNTIALYDSLLTHERYEPIYGTHPHLKDFNRQGLFMGLSELFAHIIKQNASFKLSAENRTNECREYLLNPDSRADIKQFFMNHSSRLVFIFNRLTSLGFLLRSPLLKGLGYHPLINTDVPNRIYHNLEVLLELLAASTHEQQYSFIEQIIKDKEIDQIQLSSIIK